MRHLRRAALCAASLALLSCGDFTGPGTSDDGESTPPPTGGQPGGGTLSVEGQADSIVVVRDELGDLAIDCTLRLQTRASGGSVAMLGGMLRIFVGDDWSAAVDSIDLPYEVLHALSGPQNVLGPDVIRRTSFRFRGITSYGLQTVLTYRPADGVPPARALTTLVACGPRPSAPPTVDSVQFTGPVPTRAEAGRAFGMHLFMSAPNGLLATALVSAGDCRSDDQATGTLETQRTWSVTVTIPVTCAVGSRIDSVQVRVTDATRQTASRWIPLEGGITVVDTTPPTVHGLALTIEGISPGTTDALALDWDVIEAVARVGDRRPLTWAGWESPAGQRRDSVAVALDSTTLSLTFAATAAAGDEQILRAWGRDEAGNVTPADSGPARQIRVLPKLDLATTRLSGYAVEGYHAARDLVIVREGSTGIGVRTLGGESVLSIPDRNVGAHAFSRGGDTLFVVFAGERAIAVLPLAAPDPATAHRIALPMLDDTVHWVPRQLQVDGDGRVFASWLGTLPIRDQPTERMLIAVEPDSGTAHVVLHRGMRAPGQEGFAMCPIDLGCDLRTGRSGDGRTLAVVDGHPEGELTLSVYDVPSGQFVASRAIASSDWPTLSTSGDRILLRQQLYDRALVPLPDVSASGLPVSTGTVNGSRVIWVVHPTTRLVQVDEATIRATAGAPLFAEPTLTSVAIHGFPADDGSSVLVRFGWDTVVRVNLP